MARIPDDEIERLKREIPIERLVKGFGVELKPTGANLAGHCPFHEDQALAHRHPGHQSVALQPYPCSQTLGGTPLKMSEFSFTWSAKRRPRATHGIIQECRISRLASVLAVHLSGVPRAYLVKGN